MERLWCVLQASPATQVVAEGNRCQGPGEVGLEPDRRAVFGDRLRKLPLGLQGDAEVVVGLGEVGLEPDRRAVGGDRLIQLALLPGRCPGCCGPRRSRA